MKKNGIIIQPLPCLIFCSLFLVNYSIRCSERELIDVTKQIKVYSEEELFAQSLFLIASRSEQYKYPTTLISTFTRINKIFYKTVHDMISEIVIMINEAKKYRSEYNCTDLRKNWLVNQIHIFDKAFAFQLFSDLGKKYIIHEKGSNPSKSLICIDRCVNYLSVRTDLSVRMLSRLFRCLKYLEYYTFNHDKRFNLYEPRSECILS